MRELTKEYMPIARILYMSYRGILGIVKGLLFYKLQRGMDV